MSSKISLRTNIKLEHRDLDGEYKQKILNNSRVKLKNTTSVEGYILDVLNVEKIFGNKIKNNSVVFDVNLQTLCIKLEKGVKITGKVSMLFPHGVFAELHTIKLFVPEKDLKKFKYNNEEECFMDGKKTIKKDDDVELEITDLKFENGNYKCITKLY